MTKKNTNNVDIVIIGAGVAGCMAAIALSNDYHVVLIDKLEVPAERVGECLAPAAQRILKQLDLLNDLETFMANSQQAVYLKNIGTQSYWGSEHVQIVDHLRNPDGFGWHLNRQLFESFLRQTALKRGVECLCPYTLEHCHYEHFRWHITVVSESDRLASRKIEASFVIDATGRQAHFTKKLGIQRVHLDHLVACWATVPNREVNQMSTILANQLGWWYSAPLPNNQRVISFQTDSDLINRGVLKKMEQFVELSQHNHPIATLLPKDITEIQFHGIVAANSSCLSQVAGQQWVALGDAALSFDPLSSQGMFNAMATSLQMTDLLLQSNLIHQPNTTTIEQFATHYTNQINQIWKHYLYHKRIFYQAEQRWKHAPFWQRRH